jgi:hypothetical protein
MMARREAREWRAFVRELFADLVLFLYPPATLTQDDIWCFKRDSLRQRQVGPSSGSLDSRFASSSVQLQCFHRCQRHSPFAHAVRAPSGSASASSDAWDPPVHLPSSKQQKENEERACREFIQAHCMDPGMLAAALQAREEYARLHPKGPCRCDRKITGNKLKREAPAVKREATAAAAAGRSSRATSSG